MKIILKKNVKGNEQMVYDELAMLESLHHPHIVKFHDWFESRVGATDPRILWYKAMLTSYRTNTISSPNLRQEESCLTESASMGSLPKRTQPKQSNKYWML